MSSILTVNGTAYDQSARKANSLLVDAWGWDLDADWSCEWHEHTAGPSPRFTGPVPVSLSVSGTTVFTGDLVSVQPSIGGDGTRTWGYRCLGLQYRADWIPVTAVDFSGTIRFNTSPTDTINYVASMAGQSVGQILSYCLTQHATALTAAGIATDATTASQLAAQTLVPQAEVIVAGERLWSALEDVLRQYARNLRLIITPAGLVRLADVTAGTNHTLTVGTDPVDPPLFNRNWTTNATRVAVRGRGIIEPGYVSVSKSTLTPAWTSPEQAAWNWAGFSDPVGASDSGTVSAVGSTTSVTIHSTAGSNPGVNYWSGLQAWIYLINTGGSGLTYTEARPITANTAGSGGSCTVTVAYDLNNGTYTNYYIAGTNVPLSAGGTADVWRLYDVTDPGSRIANHLVRSFPVQVPFLDYYGQGAALTSNPTGQVVGPSGSGPAFFQVLPGTGQVLFYRPVVEGFNTASNLALGGSHVTAPTDIYLLLAYSRGVLQTPYPPDIAGVPQYSGTAYSVSGLQRTQYVDVDAWQYAGNVAVMGPLARMLQVSVRNTLIEGTVSYRGYYATVQDPSSGGHLLSFAGNGYTTGDESLQVPVRAATYRYLTAGGGLLYTTEIRCTTRQDPRTGESQYMHLSHLGQGAMALGGQLDGTGFGGGRPTSGGVTGTNLFDQAGGSMPGEMAEAEAPRKRRKRTRLGSEAERFQAAEAHDAGDRQGRAVAEQRAADNEETPDEKEDRDRVVQSDNARRARVLDGGGPAVPMETPDERENRERVARSDNTRRARTLKSRRRPTPEQEGSSWGEGDAG